eukprot:TRINITY_DN75932_c0_g1_i1.p1 TRINITY_DN75932_c0_g1~~TRINITY_DN75932_c0_g1_i1.p1  ORF type:complete len:161 (+),score=21.47 TRINITY_DN75932_c0_g1_i1:115-597(+)
MRRAWETISRQREGCGCHQGKKMTVMMFGMTGAGKSALGNLLAGHQYFASGDDTASVTNKQSVMRYEAADGSLIVLDTIGLGDTQIDQEKVVNSIRDSALSAPNGSEKRANHRRCDCETDLRHRVPLGFGVLAESLRHRDIRAEVCEQQCRGADMDPTPE